MSIHDMFWFTNKKTGLESDNLDISETQLVMLVDEISKKKHADGETN